MSRATRDEAALGGRRRAPLCRELAYAEGEGCLLLRIAPGFQGGRNKLAAIVMSQYVSNVLLSVPRAAQPVKLELVGGQVISQPYIEMTIAMMHSFGVAIVCPDIAARMYHIPNGGYGAAPARYEIESDASSATYPPSSARRAPSPASAARRTLRRACSSPVPLLPSRHACRFPRARSTMVPTAQGSPRGEALC